MSQYLLFIILILVQSFICFGIKQNLLLRKIFLVVVFFELALLIGLRSVNVGEDTAGYFGFFQFLNYSSGWNIFDYRQEFGFILLNKVIGLFTYSGQALFLVSGFFIVYSTLKFINENTKTLWLGVLLYITLDKFSFDMAALRQALALAVLLFSYKYILQRRIAPFLCIVAAAMCFHVSAGIFLILYPLYRIKLNLINVLAIFIAVLFGAVIVVNFSSYVSYVNSVWWGLQLKLSIFMYFSVAVSILILAASLLHIQCKKDKTFLKTDSGREFKLLFYINIVFAIIALLAFFGTIFSRLFIYFLVFELIFIPKILDLFYSAQLKRIVTVIVMLAAITYQGVIVQYRPDWSAVVPYEFYWQAQDNIRTKITTSTVDRL